MFNFLHKLFRKPAPKVAVPRVVARAMAPAQPDANQPRPQVEVAHLSLAAILSKFPEDLKQNVANFPDASVTVAPPYRHDSQAIGGRLSENVSSQPLPAGAGWRFRA